MGCVERMKFSFNRTVFLVHPSTSVKCISASCDNVEFYFCSPYCVDGQLYWLLDINVTSASLKTISNKFQVLCACFVNRSPYNQIFLGSSFTSDPRFIQDDSGKNLINDLISEMRDPLAVWILLET